MVDSKETLAPNQLDAWLGAITHEDLVAAFDQLVYWGSADLKPHQGKGSAAWAITHAPALDELYKRVYPDAPYQHERLHLLQVDLHTMQLHHSLLEAKFMDDNAAIEVISPNLNALLFGTTDETMLPRQLPLESLAGMPSGHWRIATGVSPEFKALMTQVRLLNPGPRLQEYFASNLDWREAVCSTLELDFLAVRDVAKIGGYLDAGPFSQ